MKYEKILDGWQETIDYTEISAICEAIQKRYPWSAPAFWMAKAFQFGYAYGKAAERAKKKQIHK